MQSFKKFLTEKGSDYWTKPPGVAPSKPTREKKPSDTFTKGPKGFQDYHSKRDKAGSKPKATAKPSSSQEPKVGAQQPKPGAAKPKVSTSAPRPKPSMGARMGQSQQTAKPHDIAAKMSRHSSKTAGTPSAHPMAAKMGHSQQTAKPSAMASKMSSTNARNSSRLGKVYGQGSSGSTGGHTGSTGASTGSSGGGSGGGAPKPKTSKQRLQTFSQYHFQGGTHYHFHGGGGGQRGGGSSRPPQKRSSFLGRLAKKAVHSIASRSLGKIGSGISSAALGRK